MSLFQQIPDMQTMYPIPQGQQYSQMPMVPQQQPLMDGSMVPNGLPSAPAEMPQLNGPNPNAFKNPQQLPTYVGNPVLDMYIHKFIGA